MRRSVTVRSGGVRSGRAVARRRRRPHNRDSMAVSDDRAADGRSKKGAKHWALFAVRWGVCVVGVAYVVLHLSIRDQAWVILDMQSMRPQQVTLDRTTDESAPVYPVRVGGTVRDVPRAYVVNEPDRRTVDVRQADGTTRAFALLGVHVENDVAERFLVAETKDGPARWVQADGVVGYQAPRPYPHPRQQMGLKRMFQQADPKLLWAALLVFPLTFVLTSYRWHELLKVLEIDLSFGRAFVLNMVGCFWNTLIPGSTGGDVIKALYVSKLTPFRTRAVMSVLVDRAVGLLALVILGGTMAAFQWNVPACRRVAVASAALCGCTAVGLAVFLNPTLHRLSGLDAVLRRLPKQKQVRGAVDTLRRYAKRPLLSLWSLVVSFPVHATVVTSAMLAGMAFGLPLHWQYYWVCVPVIVLAAAIPISFQGAGVMEALTVLLTHSQGVSVSQAVALAMSVRMVQILWNLAGGVFVLRGGIHGPTAGEQASLDDDGGDALPGAAGEPAVLV